MKQCSKCKARLPHTAFGKNAARKDGLQSQCRGCKRATQAAWYNRNRDRHKANARKNKKAAREVGREFVFNYLLEHPCVDCGEANPILLDFDHIDESTKTKALSVMVGEGWSVSRIKDEIAKCAVRCVRCHRLRTFERAGYWMWHRMQQHDAE